VLLIVNIWPLIGATDRVKQSILAILKSH